MSELFQQYQNYVLSSLAFIIIALLSRIDGIRSAIVEFWNIILKLMAFVGDGFTESNGKTSYARLAGSFVIYKITEQAANIPEQWMTLFMYLIGYQLISGLLKDNPAIVEFIKARYGATPEKKEVSV